MPETPTATYPSVLAVASAPSNEPRFFVNDAIQSAVDKALADLPSAHSVSLRVQGGDGHIATVITARLGDHWTVQGAWDTAVGDAKGTGSNWHAQVTWKG